MKNYSYIIIGAGPAGLAFAHSLLKLGEESFIVLEKESEAGGLCRSEIVAGSPLDMGGGHFLGMAHPEVLDLIFSFLPMHHWKRFSRVSKIRLKSFEIDFPVETGVWQLPPDLQLDYLESISCAGCLQGVSIPESFEDWVVWKLGERIANEYLLPYNKKLWSVPLDSLGIQWLHKLPHVSFRETLASCLQRRALDIPLAHKSFFYPLEYGYGEVWKRMGNALGERLLRSTAVTSIDIENMVVNGEFKADRIVNTIPWPVWSEISDMPSEIREAVNCLKHVSINVDYFPETLSTNAHWIYEPDPAISYHRILCRSNFSRGHGYWTETNSKREVGLSSWQCKNEFAYPVPTLMSQTALVKILKWCNGSRLIPVGRWGLWEHLNSDEVVSGAIKAAQHAYEEK